MKAEAADNWNWTWLILAVCSLPILHVVLAPLLSDRARTMVHEHVQCQCLVKQVSDLRQCSWVPELKTVSKRHSNAGGEARLDRQPPQRRYSRLDNIAAAKATSRRTSLSRSIEAQRDLWNNRGTILKRAMSCDEGEFVKGGLDSDSVVVAPVMPDRAVSLPSLAQFDTTSPCAEVQRDLRNNQARAVLYDALNTSHTLTWRHSHPLLDDTSLTEITEYS
eukprot:1179301-Prorocentrum_minimum.AAC.2